MKIKKLLFASILIAGFGKLFAQPSVTLSTFCSGFTWPTKIANCGDSRLFVIQKTGKIFIVDSLGIKNPTPFIDLSTIATVPASVSSERGTLGITFHPNYVQNGYIYIDYTRASDGATRVSRFTRDSLDANKANLNTELNLLTIAQPYSNHNGGNLEFGKDGYLYIGMGDGGSGNDPNNNAINLNSYLGKMLRIDVDNAANGLNYGIPASNPFADTTSTTVKKEIWTYGMRNPWRWSFDKLNGDLWIGDVGQDAYEEIDYQAANSAGGQFYGWRCWEGFHTNTASAAITSGCAGIVNSYPPIFEYPHSFNQSCSVTGGNVYRGGQFNEMYVYYFHIDYCSGYLRWNKRSDAGTFTSGLAATNALALGFVTFGENRDGELFMANINDGKVYRMNGANCKPTATIGYADSSQICEGTILQTPYAANLHYQWSYNGNVLANDTLNHLIGNNSGLYSVTVTKNACATPSIASANLLVNPLPTLTFSSSYPTLVDSSAQSFTIQTSQANAVITIDDSLNNNFNPILLGIGNHIVSATFTNAAGCSKTISQVIAVANTTGLQNQNFLNGISIYPNPTSENMFIQLYHNYSKSLTISIADVSGRVINTCLHSLISGNNLVEINLQQLNSGTYFLKLSDGYNVENKRICVQK